jgi:hypothetical protein
VRRGCSPFYAGLPSVSSCRCRRGQTGQP